MYKHEYAYAVLFCCTLYSIISQYVWSTMEYLGISYPVHITHPLTVILHIILGQVTVSGPGRVVSMYVL